MSISKKVFVKAVFYSFMNRKSRNRRQIDRNINNYLDKCRKNSWKISKCKNSIRRKLFITSHFSVMVSENRFYSISIRSNGAGEVSRVLIIPRPRFSWLHWDPWLKTTLIGFIFNCLRNKTTDLIPKNVRLLNNKR